MHNSFVANYPTASSGMTTYTGLPNSLLYSDESLVDYHLPHDVDEKVAELQKQGVADEDITIDRVLASMPKKEWEE